MVVLLTSGRLKWTKGRSVEPRGKEIRGGGRESVEARGRQRERRTSEEAILGRRWTMTEALFL